MQCDVIGGVVFRRGRGEFIDVQIEREIAADKAEIDRLDSEYKQAVGEAKTKLKVKVDAARKRYESEENYWSRESMRFNATETLRSN